MSTTTYDFYSPEDCYHVASNIIHSLDHGSIGNGVAAAHALNLDRIMEFLRDRIDKLEEENTNLKEDVEDKINEVNQTVESLGDIAKALYLVLEYPDKVMPDDTKLLQKFVSEYR